MSEEDDGLRNRLTRQGEEALGRVAQELLESPVVSGALTRAFGAREKAAQAQEVAMGALNLPSAADLERLTRRLRSVSQRLEGIEDALDRVDQHVEAIGTSSAIENRLIAIEADVERLSSKVEQAVTPADVERLGSKLDKAATRSDLERLESRVGKAVKDSGKAKSGGSSRAGAASDKRLKSIESQLGGLAGELSALREALPGATEPVPTGQERLEVSEASG